MTVPATAYEVRLASRPHGWPTRDNFEVAEDKVPTPARGQVLVRNQVMSVDPSMRGRMEDTKGYVAPSFQLGRVMEGAAVGEVVTSRADALTPGQVVMHSLGWREYAVVDADQVIKVDPDLAPLGAYLGVLGLPGLTAYAGLLRTAEFTKGDAVFVSGAAGAVGAVAGQIARLRGASRVIGSAGTADKVRHLTEDLGFDAAFNYHDAPVAEQLAKAAPEGIDVYFDNVGGEHLEAAINALQTNGRITACGMISVYNATEPTPAPHNLRLVIGKRLALRGMLVTDHFDLYEEFLHEVGDWIRHGELRYQETVVNGLHNAPDAFLGMLRGENTGKMLVHL